MGKTTTKTKVAKSRMRKTPKLTAPRELSLRLHFTPGKAWSSPLRRSELKRIMKNSPLDQEVWLGIIALSKAEWAGTKPLDSVRSERVKLVEQLIERSREVYGDKDMADRWFNRTNPYLGGQAPKEVLDSLTGIAEAMAELERIEAGVFA